MNLDHHPGIQVRNGEISEITELQLLMQRVLPLYVSPARTGLRFTHIRSVSLVQGYQDSEQCEKAKVIPCG